MKIALDLYMLRTGPLVELPRLVADLGYEHIELSPRADFIPWWVHPRAYRATINAFKKALKDRRHLGPPSVLPMSSGGARSSTSARPPSATGSGPSRSRSS